VCGQETAHWQRGVTVDVLVSADADDRCTSLELPTNRTSKYATKPEEAKNHVSAKQVIGTS